MARFQFVFSDEVINPSANVCERLMAISPMLQMLYRHNETMLQMSMFDKNDFNAFLFCIEFCEKFSRDRLNSILCIACYFMIYDIAMGRHFPLVYSGEFAKFLKSVHLLLTNQYLGVAHNICTSCKVPVSLCTNVPSSYDYFTRKYRNMQKHFQWYTSICIWKCPCKNCRHLNHLRLFDPLKFEEAKKYDYGPLLSIFYKLSKRKL